jgi:hypothetical protein
MEITLGQSNEAVMEVYSAEDILEKDQSILHSLSVPLQDLVLRFSHVFAVPHSLPPERVCDHKIPLIPGARPVQMRPYRYAPALKSEIEKQVADMLQSGIIESSKSEFSSSVILVKKKMTLTSSVYITDT